VLPNFFIVGAPKAGTTSLYHEANHFASEIRKPLSGSWVQLVSDSAADSNRRT